jgi:hypothetical protein
MTKKSKLSKTEWKKLQVQARKLKLAAARAEKIKLDGELTATDIKQIRSALRQVWGRSSLARKLCIKRATGKDGFAKCELCKKKVPKVAVDHIQALGDVQAPDYIKRLWCHSSKLQALCLSCHGKKTRAERKAQDKPKKKLFTDEN